MVSNKNNNNKKRRSAGSTRQAFADRAWAKTRGTLKITGMAKGKIEMNDCMTCFSMCHSSFGSETEGRKVTCRATGSTKKEDCRMRYEKGQTAKPSQVKTSQAVGLLDTNHDHGVNTVTNELCALVA